MHQRATWNQYFAQSYLTCRLGAARDAPTLQLVDELLYLLLPAALSFSPGTFPRHFVGNQNAGLDYSVPVNYNPSITTICTPQTEHTALLLISGNKNTSSWQDWTGNLAYWAQWADGLLRTSSVSTGSIPFVGFH